MNDPFLMGMLNRLTDGDEQLQTCAGAQVVLVTELGQSEPVDQFHHEVRPARLGGPGVQYSSDIQMVHHGQGLSLGLEPGDYVARVHARLDDLQRHFAADRLSLLRHVHDAHAPFANLLHQLIGADPGAGEFDGRVGDSSRHRCPGDLKETACLRIHLQ